jgi:adenylate kinase
LAKVTPPQHLVIFGRPGSGKSSLAEHLGADFGYQLVRTGEMLREAIRRGDYLGSRVEQHLISGDLVPDQLIFELLEQNLRLNVLDRTKLLFDGFPRTLGQVELLAGFEKRLGFTIGCYLDITISRAEAIARMTGRRVCPVCGTTYHVIAKPPRIPETCDNDGSPLERRKDDTIEVVAFRQKLYDEQTEPILAYYRTACPERCCSVNGAQSVEAVYAETLRVLGLERQAQGHELAAG